MTSDQTTDIIITAPEDVDGGRLDRFLATQAEQAPELDAPLSRTRIKALIQDGAVFENSTAVTDPSTPVRAGASYRLVLPPVRDATPKGQDIPLNILFEDDHLIVLDKPAGLVVHPGPGQPDGTLVNALLAHCGDSLTGIGGVMRPGIVHRLDKDTSGVMMAAKTDRAHQRLTEMFAAHDLDRCYHALVWGTLAERDGRIEAPLGRSNRDRKQQAVVPNGRFAATNWTGLRQLPPFASLVECRLETGRTHQIRVHMAHIGHPVLGDKLYGTGMKSRAVHLSEAQKTALEALDRQALHATALGFEHPRTGKTHFYEASLPQDLAALLEAMAKLPI